MSNPHIITTTADRVLTIEISRREKKNAITVEMYHALSDALDQARTDDDVGAVCLHGQADLFTAGNDLADFLVPNARKDGKGHRFLETISSFPKPIVAAVGGPAIGIGCTMLMHCDLVVASDTARFQLPFVKLGLCPEAASSMLLPQMAGPRLAAELMLLGDFFNAETAQRAGIVNYIVPAAGVIEAGGSLAARLAHEPMDALITTKALLKRPLGRPISEALADEYAQFERLLASDTTRTILQSFFKKPKFRRFYVLEYGHNRSHPTRRANAFAPR